MSIGRDQLASYFDRKQTDSARRETQSLLQMASAVGKMGAWSVEVPSLDARYSAEARAIQELDESRFLSVEELIELYVPGCRERVGRAFAACVEKGTPFDEELQLTTKTGRTIWVRAIGEAIRDSEGRIIRVQGALQDIDDLKQLKNSLASSGLRLRQLVESMPMTVWMANGTTERRSKFIFRL